MSARPSVSSAVSRDSRPKRQDECLAYYGSVNLLYFSRFPVLASHSGRIRTLIIGDSTMELASQIKGYITEGTLSHAVSGNTACDMIVQLRAARFLQPDAVFVSTADGNGLLSRRVTLERIAKTNARLNDKLVEMFGVKPVWVAVHPTLVDYANENKGHTNAETKAAVMSAGGCWFDPLPLFGVTEGQPAKASDLLDSIHPSENMTLAIKAGAQAACPVVL